MAKSKCKDCTSRYVGCHSKCEDYANFKAEREKAKARRYAVSDYWAYKKEQIYETKRKYGKGMVR